MELCARFKAWLVENCGVKADADDSAFRAAAAEALVKGDLTAAKYAELNAPEPADDPFAKLGAAFSTALDPIAQQLKAQGDKLDKLAAPEPKAPEGQQAPTPSGTAAAPVTATASAVGPEPSIVDQFVAGAQQAAVGVGAAAQASAQPMIPGGNADLLKALGTAGVTASGSDGVSTPSIKEMYGTSRKAAIYPDGHKLNPGMPVEMAGRGLDHSSELDKAIIGAWFKLAVAVGGGAVWGIPKGLRMTDRDKQLVQYALHEEKFSGIVNGEGIEDQGAIKVDNRKLLPTEIKAILDDTISGGLEVAPIVFDDAIILFPLLFGELFPLVNLVNIARGRRIEGATIGNPTFTSGVAEGTEIPLFDTAAFINAFDTTIFNAVGAMEIGMDLEEDSPVNVGSIVAQKYGEQAMAWLDEQIAIGDGTTEPEGISNAAGVTDIVQSGAAADVDLYERLLFGIDKQYRDPSTRTRQVYIANETSYRRARAIAVGTSDQRRVFGLTHEDYMLFEHGYKIQQDIPNTLIMFANLSKYRMYRRLGLNIRIEGGGKELARKNLRLIIARMRYGGQLEDANAAVLTDDAEA